jgi:hypothetical protein
MTEPPATIKCQRKNSKGEICNADIPILESYYIVQAQAPQIGVKCPECNKPTTLSIANTKAYVEMYSQLRQEIEAAARYEIEQESPMEEEFSEKIIRFLEVLGYKGNKWSTAKTAIREFIDNMPSYQTPQGVTTVLTNFKISPHHIPLVVARVFGDQQNTPTMPFIMQNTPQTPPFIPSIPTPSQPQYYQPPQQPQPQYYQQQPTHYQPPHYQPPPQPQSQSVPIQTSSQPDLSNRTIIKEKLDEEGNIIEREIIPPKTEQAQPVQPAQQQASPLEAVKEVIEMLNITGVFNKPEMPDITGTIKELEEKIEQKIEAVKQTPSTTENEELKTLREELKTLQQQLINTQREQERAEFQKQIEALNQKIEKLHETPTGTLTDTQYEHKTRENLEKIRSETLEKMGSTLLTPILEMQKNQAQIQTIMAIRMMEQQDNVPPGTYVNTIAQKPIPDETVEGDLNKWKNKLEKLQKAPQK